MHFRRCIEHDRLFQETEEPSYSGYEIFTHQSNALNVETFRNLNIFFSLQLEETIHRIPLHNRLKSAGYESSAIRKSRAQAIKIVGK